MIEKQKGNQWNVSTLGLQVQINFTFKNLLKKMFALLFSNNRGFILINNRGKAKIITREYY